MSSNNKLLVSKYQSFTIYVHIKFNMESHPKRWRRPEKGGQEATKSPIAFYL
jgi:hypothetical protein